MPAFPHLPLGTPIPASPHAVSCSLPTMRAVRGYEEKNPDIVRHLTVGYPRFVVAPHGVHGGQAARDGVRAGRDGLAECEGGEGGHGGGS